MRSPLLVALLLALALACFSGCHAFEFGETPLQRRIRLRKGGQPRYSRNSGAGGRGSQADSTEVPDERESGGARVGVSRPTAEWKRLQREGLYHPDSALHPEPKPANEPEAQDLRFWTERVQREWSGGCQRWSDGVKRCLPKLIIMGQFKCGTTAMFDTLAQHPDILLPRKLEGGDWHERCPLNKPSCVIKEVNGFTRLGDRLRWTERPLLSRYGLGLLPNQTADDNRPVLEASPYYLSGMVDGFEDLTRFVRYVPDVKLIALVRNPIDRAFSEFLMFSEPPFRDGTKGCLVGHNYTFEQLAEEEIMVRSPQLLNDRALKHSCLLESTKWQTPPPLNGNSGFKGRLVRWGEYAHYAETWMRLLGPDQLIFVKNEDLDRRPQEVMSRVYKWAGLREIDAPVLHSNFAACRGSIARGAWTERVHQAAASGECSRAGAGKWSLQKTISQAYTDKLVEHYRSHNRRFSELTGIPTEDWDLGSRYTAGAADIEQRR